MSNPFAALAAETQSSSDGTPEDLDAKVEQALSCPCVSDLKAGPCGHPFVQAFTCFIKNEAEEDKGVACIEVFQLMQACMAQHPEAFADFVQSKEESGEELETGSGEGEGAAPKGQ